jgi:hypothetical protein
MIGVFFLFGSNDFSILLTFGSMIQTYGFLLITLSCIQLYSSSGLSFNTLLCYSIIFFFKTIVIIFEEQYLLLYMLILISDISPMMPLEILCIE